MNITASTAYETDLYARGFTKICGIDEAGRGPLAGPVTAAAVIFPEGVVIPGVYDSKKISASRRRILVEAIHEKAIAYALGWADSSLVDKINIRQATFTAMRRALDSLAIRPEAVLADGLPGLELPKDIHCEFLVGGDRLSHSIAAASILAKEARDAFMLQMHEVYPQYGFDAHKGYGTQKHKNALQAHGLCPLHRLSFLKFFLNPSI